MKLRRLGAGVALGALVFSAFTGGAITSQAGANSDPGGATTPQRAAVASTVAAGYGNTCAVVSGTVRCWGGTTSGITGGAPADILSAASAATLALPGGATAASVSVGRDHACALSTAGDVSCWGNDAYGRVSGSQTATHVGEIIETPTKVIVPGKAVQVAAGWNFSCALLTSGAVSCWGQVGGGSTGPTQFPSTVVLASQATSITAGRQHACAVLSNGSLQCWGYNGYGATGEGSANANGMITLSGRPIVAASASYFHTCAVTAGGEVYCWG
ncbi:MAG: hypothetical protein KDB20_03320, partial [Microthrixaceae bacterium]|nr:hypothetical protein [Microthrixaceae bacterium]